MRPRTIARTGFVIPTVLILLAACQGIIEPTNLPPPGNQNEPIDYREHGLDTHNQECVEIVSYSEEGEASWYGRPKRLRKTASGEMLDINGLTAAHRTLPLGSRIKVTNLGNGHSAILRVNDRGPFKRGRILDISQKGARDLAFIREGTARVRIETTEPAKLGC